MSASGSFIHHPALDLVRKLSWLVLCAFVPISGGLVPAPLVIAVVLLLIPAVVGFPRVPWRLLWPLFAFYGLHILGMAWTNDVDFGLFDLQVKAGLVLLPLAALVFASLGMNALRNSMLAFTAGLLVSIVLSLWKAWWCYRSGGGAACFTQSALSYDLHPSYAAWYACWAFAYWGHALLTGDVADKRMRYAVITVLLLLVVFILLLASKSGAIGLGLVVLWFLVELVRRFNGRLRIALVGAAIAVLGGAAVAVGPMVWSRMMNSVDAVERAMAGDPGILSSAEGSAMRLVAWTCSAELIAADPNGAGTGDIKHALMGCFEAKGAAPAAERRLNSHCQFLQGGVALGWAGLFITLALALVPLFLAWRWKNMPLALFSVLFILNAAVESVLEVQAGVVLMGIMLGLLAAQRSSHA